MPSVLSAVNLVEGIRVILLSTNLAPISPALPMQYSEKKQHQRIMKIRNEMFEKSLSLFLLWCNIHLVKSIAVRWLLTGKNRVDHGRGSWDLRVVFAGRALWLLPKLFFGSFSGGEGGV